MSFITILKQTAIVGDSNHFEYKSIAAFSDHLDEYIRNLSIDNIINALTKENKEGVYLIFKLENVDNVIDETVIGRVVTTNQLINILESDEFSEEPAQCSLLLGGIISNHGLFIHEGTVYDQGLEDDELEWKRDDFIEHYLTNMWRIL